MGTAQKAIFTEMGQHQWYVHLSRTDGADLGAIRGALKELMATCSSKNINLVLGFGPELLADLGGETPDDFQRFETIKSVDGSDTEAKGTQEELLLWLNSPQKDDVWKAQYDTRTALAGHMTVARETPTFIYGESLDMTGFIDGTGNPEPADEPDRAVVSDGGAAGGSFILAQRWVHDLEGWDAMSVEDQEKVFGRKKADSERLSPQEDYSHLSHVELKEGGQTGDDDSPKRNEIVRRSTPYAFHDGTVGLYFMAFCKEQAPFRERLNAMYGTDGQARDKLTDFSNPASGSFYFAPAEEQVASMLG